MVREGEMTTQGYSDAINHALAFAAKHHERQVWKGGARSPYFTQPANVAVILTRYGCDDDTIVAGILHDVVNDSVRDGYTREMLQQRIGEKFGADVLSNVLSVTQRKVDDDGIELSSDERRDDFLARLESASDSARWVAAAHQVHYVNSLLSDLRRTVDRNAVWSRAAGGRAVTVKWYRDVCDRLTAVGFNAPIMIELREAVAALESLD